MGLASGVTFSSRAIALLTLGNGCHGHGVLDAAVTLGKWLDVFGTAMSKLHDRGTPF